VYTDENEVRLQVDDRHDLYINGELKSQGVSWNQVYSVINPTPINSLAVYVHNDVSTLPINSLAVYMHNDVSTLPITSLAVYMHNHVTSFL
jgi:hypothetical protein